MVTWLRRSTSASYYALFHKIALNVAWQIAPKSSDEDRYRLTRSVEHMRITEVCRWIGGQGARTNVQPIVARLRGNADLVEVAGIFTRLQQARHEADYDHLMVVKKASTLAHYQQAVRALDLLDSLQGTRDFEEFLALIALNTPLR